MLMEVTKIGKIKQNRILAFVLFYLMFLRGTVSRISLCLNLTKIGYHVFSLDYRGYGDSTGEPTEKGVVNDLLLVYNFIRNQRQNAKLFIYGASLGSA
jgi:alpha-beta hydrolase superfamily lysophospholipase